jgi:membrane fusion protein, heavy metal efflux system
MEIKNINRKMKNLIRITMLFAIVSFLGSCTPDTTVADAEEHVEEHGEQEERPSNMVSITPEQAKVIGLTTALVVKKSLGNNIKVNGFLDLYSQDEANVNAFIGGNVSSIYYIEGDKIKKGQVLARLEHPDYLQIQLELQQSISELDYLKTEYERKEKLYKEEISSGREFQKARSEYYSTQSKIKGLKAKLKLLNLNVAKVVAGELYPTVPVVSPIDGYVGEVYVRIGDFADPGVNLFYISNNAKTHVDFRVYEKDIYKIEVGQKAYFTVANKPGQLIEAHIQTIGRTFEDDPKAVHVHAIIDTKVSDLLPGLYVEGRIVESEHMTNVIPEEAIIREGDRSFIFVKADHDDDEGEEHHDEKLSFEVVDVTTGIVDAGFVEVTFAQPLPKDAEVVVNGAYMLSSELIKGELEHDH